MKTLDLETYDLIEMNESDSVLVEGGIIPLVAIGIGWGIMLCCSAVALGMKQALDESKQK